MVDSRLPICFCSRLLLCLGTKGEYLLLASHKQSLKPGDRPPSTQSAVVSPATYLPTQISPDLVMSIGGSTDPCAMCFLYSIDKIGERENKVYSRLLCDLLNKQLKHSFSDISAGNVSWNNTTFARGAPRWLTAYS
uniref:Uncharacterized protein n=1 Tax=Falco tinnunculus TaxID=100819 RepID=A0A8C4U8I3_FALTI